MDMEGGGIDGPPERYSALKSRVYLLSCLATSLLCGVGLVAAGGAVYGLTKSGHVTSPVLGYIGPLWMPSFFGVLLEYL